MTYECSVCFDNFFQKNIIVCMCGSKVCKKCTKTYIFTSLQLAHCMKCRVEWGANFLAENFTKCWLNGNNEGQYRHHRKMVATEREKARIPETLAELSRIKKQEKEEKKHHHLISQLENHVDELTYQLRETRQTLVDVRKTFRKQNVTLTLKTPRFLCPCPVKDCRGMIQSNNFKCGVCDSRVCRRCREPREKDDGHKCNNDVVKNLKLLRNDTKPCPKCATSIYKISGCDQMWCTQCHAPFSWHTGKIVNGVIHNPHAIRWQREHGGLQRDVRDVPCGGLIQFYSILGVYGIPKSFYYRFELMHRVVADTVHKLFNGPNENFGDLRLDYVLKIKTKKQWIQAIFIRERHNERKRVNRQILQTFQHLSIERFRHLHDTLKENIPSKSAKYLMYKEARLAASIAFEKEMEEIRVFINKAFTDELPLLGTKNPLKILDSWHWGTTYYPIWCSI